VELSKPTKILVGALTLWPVLYVFVFIAFAFAMVIYSGSNPTHSQEPPAGLILLFAVHMATILMALGLVVFYIVYLFKTDRVAQDKKALWAAVLFLGGMIAMPVFFYLYVWPEAAAQKP
jgi:hypothetical protein